jgi:hypothetical protein
MYTRFHVVALLFSAVVATILTGDGEARAQASPMERLQQCDRDLCNILRMPTEPGRPLQCELSQTWYKDQIEKVAKSKGLTWVLGDAHCKLKLNIARAVISRAVTEDSYKLKVPDQAATCDVQYRGSLYPVKVSVAPEIEFRNGKAVTVMLGIGDIEANAIVKALVWSAAKLQEKMGLYQEDFVKGINRYIEHECRAKPGGRRQAGLEEMLRR